MFVDACSKLFQPTFRKNSRIEDRQTETRLKGLTLKALANSSPGVVATLGLKLRNKVNAESVGQNC
jgi:hypothetical protein